MIKNKCISLHGVYLTNAPEEKQEVQAPIYCTHLQSVFSKDVKVLPS